MRGESDNQTSLFSYVSLESRIPDHHPIRKIRGVVDKALAEMAPEFDAMYAASGRPSIPPEQLIRALLLQIFFTIRSERQLVERLDYDLMFRWFVGLGMDDPVWNHSTFSKNRDRLMRHNIDELLFEAIKKQAYQTVEKAHYSLI
jgi:transposase